MFAQPENTAVKLIQDIHQIAPVSKVVIRLPQDFSTFRVAIAHAAPIGNAFPFQANLQFAYDDDGNNLSTVAMDSGVSTMSNVGGTSAGAGSGPGVPVQLFMPLMEPLAGPGAVGFAGVLDIIRPLGATQVFGKMVAAFNTSSFQWPTVRGHLSDVNIKSAVISPSSGTMILFAKVYGFRDGGLL